jgi:hypothetical protein
MATMQADLASNGGWAKAASETLAPTPYSTSRWMNLLR